VWCRKKKTHTKDEKSMAIQGVSTPERQTTQGFRIPDYSKNNYKELMNILDGFGYINPEDISKDFDKKALIDFQKYMKLTADGVYGPKTQEKLAEVMRILHGNLNKVLGTNFSFNEPFYGPKTTEAVEKFQKKYNVGAPAGQANLVTRTRLAEEASKR
jgi:N-acetyl-anhydromuramyl-L-alanine amidase AmpD